MLLCFGYRKDKVSLSGVENSLTKQEGDEATVLCISPLPTVSDLVIDLAHRWGR